MSASASKSNQSQHAQQSLATRAGRSRWKTAQVESRDARVASLDRLFNRIDVAWKDMQRDPALKKRTHSVRFSVNDYEKAVIEYVQALQGDKRTGAFAREQTLQGSVGHKVHRLAEEDSLTVKKLLFELNRVGNNLNQIARALNIAINEGLIETRLAEELLISVQEVGSVLKRNEKHVEKIELKGL